MRLIILVCTIIIAGMSCTSDPQELVIFKNMEHESDSNIKNTKNIILKRISEINEWYIYTNRNIIFYQGNNQWEYLIKRGNLFPRAVSDSIRFKYIADSIIPPVKGYPLFSKSFKKKIIENYRKFEDPGNLAFLMCGHDLASEMSRLLIQGNGSFHIYMGNSDLVYGDDPENDIIPIISEEDKQNLYYEMITVNGNKAHMVIDYGCIMSDPPKLYDKYIVYSFKYDKKNGWLMNNMQILIEGGLIRND